MVGSRVITLISKHGNYRKRTLNLIPSENIMSKAALRALSSDLASRYSSRPEFYGGTYFARSVWEEAESLARDVFEADYVILEPLSGHHSNMIALYALTSKGDRVACLAPEDGGYPGYEQERMPDVLGLKIVRLPFNRESRNIDSERALELIRKEKPKVVVFGASIFLFPHPVKEIADEVHGYGGYVIYDGSHVLGLIAGKVFQDPLKEGADLLVGSTHKSFFGPQGGIILGNNGNLIAKFKDKVYHVFVDNPHLNRIASLAVALEEMRRFGRDYARKVVDNASRLASELDSRGVKVFKCRDGYTASHQVLMELGREEGFNVRDRLEEAYIVVDAGVRLGTNEVTRKGMREKEMATIAKLISDRLDGESPSVVRKRVFKLTSRFTKVRFSLDKG